MKKLNIKAFNRKLVLIVFFLAPFWPHLANGQIISRSNVVVDEDTIGISCKIHVWADKSGQIHRDTSFRDMVVNIKLNKGEIKNSALSKKMIFTNVIPLMQLCVVLKYHRLILSLGDEEGGYFPRTYILDRCGISFFYDNYIDWKKNTLEIKTEDHDRFQTF